MIQAIEMATNTRAGTTKATNAKSNIPVQASNITTPKQNTTTDTSTTPMNINFTPISASKNPGLPFNFARYHIDPQDYHMEPEDLQHVCKQILWITQLRQSYKIIEEQMRIVASILPKSSPNYGRVDEVQDIINWVQFQRELCEESGITHITTTNIEIIDKKQVMHTKTFDVKDSINQNFKVKKSAVVIEKDIQTDENFTNNSDGNQTRNKTINMEPSVMHPTVKKLDDIRKKFTTKKLVADCGDDTIGNRTEYEYFAYVRKQVTWLVKSWQQNLDSPHDRRNKERLTENEELVEDIISEATSEKMKLLIGKAFRNVKANFRNLFYATTKLNKNFQDTISIQQNQQNGPWNNYQQNQYNGYQQNQQNQYNGYQQNGQWNGQQGVQSGRWNGQQWRQEQNGQWMQGGQSGRYRQGGQQQGGRQSGQQSGLQNNVNQTNTINSNLKNLITNILKQIQEQ